MTLSHSHTRRAKTPVNQKLERNLTTYVAAAGATAVALMTAQAAQARVIYTPANISIGVNTSNPLDLNGDGITDLTIQYFEGSHSLFLYGNIPAGNGLRVNGSFAAAGFFGLPVGPGENFGGGTHLRMEGFGAYQGFSFETGAWYNVTDRYLGVKFVISGQTHYGWIRMTTTGLNPVISGYAYETTPNTRIKDGAVSGPAVGTAATNLGAPANASPSLGALALGAQGIAIWRRGEAAR